MANGLDNAKSLDEILALFRDEDELALPAATGQPTALLQHLDQRDWKQLKIFTGLITGPFPVMMKPNVSVVSGFYGPIERLLHENGARMAYLPANFRGLELYAQKHKFRVCATTVSPPDADGFVTFGSHSAAIYKPFVATCRDPERLAIAEINPHMPVVYGDEAYGDNKIHLDELDYYYESDIAPQTMPKIEATETDRKIADNVMDLIESGATLQFGIGGVPDHVASLVASSQLSDFGMHSELISDGFLRLYDAGKISNQRKGQFDGQTVYTFAFGAQELYDFIDERKGRNKRQVICLPVSIVNDPAVIARNNNFISVNSGLMVDFAGQICSEAIGIKQYSGIGGQLSFVQGAYASEGGKSILCIKSTVTSDGKTYSNIVPELPKGSVVSTPRHFTQYVVTEYGVADLYGVTDEQRPEKLIAIAHPDFRDELTETYLQLKRDFYHN